MNKILIVTNFNDVAGYWTADIFLGGKRQCWARGSTQAAAIVDARRTFRTTRGCRG